MTNLLEQMRLKKHDQKFVSGKKAEYLKWMFFAILKGFTLYAMLNPLKC